MPNFLNLIKSLRSSSWAGAYSFLFLFLFVRLTGEQDFLGFINSKLFPESGSFGAMELRVRPLAPKPESKTQPVSGHLLLVRQSTKETRKISLVRTSSQAPAPIALVGSTNLGVSPKSRELTILDPLVLADVELPSKALLGVVLLDEDLFRGDARQRLHLISGSTEKEFQRKGDLAVSTSNEQRNIRILYFSAIGFLLVSIIILPRFSSIVHPGDAPEPGHPETDFAAAVAKRNE